MSRSASLAGLALIGLGLASRFAGAGALPAAQPSAATIRAYEGYLRRAESQMAEDYGPRGEFVSKKLLAGPKTSGKSGAVLIAPLSGGDSSGVPISGGLIHDWIGIVFIPGVRLPQVLRTVQDYNHAADHYAPNVTKSRLLAHSGDCFQVFLQLKQREGLTVLFDTEYEIRYVRLNASRVYSVSHSTRIAQLSRLSKDFAWSAGRNDGFLWRLDSYWRFEQVAGGVYVQCRVISLSRAIPRGLGWIVTPFAKNVPRKSLLFTLSATRAAVLADLHKASPRDQHGPYQKGG